MNMTESCCLPMVILPFDIDVSHQVSQVDLCRDVVNDIFRQRIKLLGGLFSVLNVFDNIDHQY